MNDLMPLHMPDDEVFLGTRPISLAEVVSRVESEMTGTRQRDTLSAFRSIATKGEIDLAAIPATANEVRIHLEALTASDLGVTPKRLANIKALIAGAIERFGAPRTWITRSVTPAPQWQALLAKAPKREYVWSLSRLACYCTVKGLRPEDVRPETLIGLLAALEAECISRKPRSIIKQTIAIWNMCRRQVPDWPQITLSSPTRTDPFMLPLSAFPEGFQADIAAWERRMTTPDPLDPSAPTRPLRAATLASYVLTFRRAASALVRNEVLQIEQITGLDVLVQPENLKAGLRPFLPPQGSDRDTGYVHKMAVQLRAVAQYLVGADQRQLREITAIVNRLSPRNVQGMRRRNRERLKPFDDEAIVQRLLRFPAEEYARARHQNNLLRRAKGVERALAIALLISTGLRVKTLRTLRIDTQIARRGGRTFLHLAGSDMKTGRELDLELPPETVELLDRFLEDHRGRLPGADGPYLFSSPDGGPRSYSAMRDAVSRAVRKHLGIELSPHLFRHIIAKIVIEREPSLMNDVSRMLGHKSINTTYSAYLGTETPAASRRINRLLQEVRGTAKPEASA
jgi:integrase